MKCLKCKSKNIDDESVIYEYRKNSKNIKKTYIIHRCLDCNYVHKEVIIKNDREK